MGSDACYVTLPTAQRVLHRSVRIRKQFFAVAECRKAPEPNSQLSLKVLQVLH
jgi:hypothetical protein